MTPAETNALQIEKRKLEAQIAKMKLLSTKSNFFKYYFSQLNQHKSNSDCFNAVNEEYRMLFGQYRYSDYSVFRTLLTRENKK